MAFCLGSNERLARNTPLYSFFHNSEFERNLVREIFSFNERQASLYIFPSKDQLNLNDIEGKAVVLTGEARVRKAYFVENHQLIEKFGSLFVNVHFEDLAQLHLLNTQWENGRVIINEQNSEIANLIINRAFELQNQLEEINEPSFVVSY